MATRRTFIQVAAGTALPVSAGLRAADVPASATTLQRRELGAVVIDSGHAEARDFGDRLDPRGAKVLSIREGDVTTAWLNSIRPLWLKRRATVAGLTTPAALFCLEQLAWQHGLRVVFHAEHTLQLDGRLDHRVQRDPQMARLTASNLQRAGTRWPARLADAMAARSTTSIRRPGPSLAALQPTLPEGALLLTSWIIAAA
jgi:hypothetical protein